MTDFKVYLKFGCLLGYIWLPIHLRYISEALSISLKALCNVEWSIKIVHSGIGTWGFITVLALFRVDFLICPTLRRKCEGWHEKPPSMFQSVLVYAIVTAYTAYHCTETVR